MPSFSAKQLAIVLTCTVVFLIAAGIPARRVLSGPPPTPTATATATATVTPTATITPSATVAPTASSSPAASTTPAVTALPSATRVVTASTGYWHTSGSRIVDSTGHTVRIAAVNWFGMENIFYVPAGLDRQPLDAILARVEELGFNAIRLPFSDQLVETNPVVTSHLDANPDLQELHALTILDRIVASARAHHLRIILDDGRSEAGTSPEKNGLWYTPRYPERAWIHDWLTLVRRYAGNPTVVGVDLRNEPHTGPPGPWSLTAYFLQGATWGPYDGVDNVATDWRLAAERAGNAILAANPHLLIIVEGLQLYPDLSRPRGVDTYWWGGVLQQAGRYPVRLSVAHRLVYSPHEYGPYKVRMWFFTQDMSYTSLRAVWEKHWGYLLHPARSPVPIFIGEFGTCGQPQCVRDATPGSTGLWFTFFMRYLKEHPGIGWAYWALNGTNQRGADCPNYILKRDWRTVRLQALLSTLHGVGLAARSAAGSPG